MPKDIISKLTTSIVQINTTMFITGFDLDRCDLLKMLFSVLYFHIYFIGLFSQDEAYGAIWANGFRVTT